MITHDIKSILIRSVSMDDDDKKEGGDTDENFDSDGLKNDPELESVIVAASPHISIDCTSDEQMININLNLRPREALSGQS